MQDIAIPWAHRLGEVRVFFMFSHLSLLPKELCIFNPSLCFVLQRFLYLENCTMLRFRKGENYTSFFLFFFFWKARKESCDLGKERKQKTDTVLRQIRFREEDTWKDLENDFFKTAQGPRKGYVCPQGWASSTLKSSALKDIGVQGINKRIKIIQVHFVSLSKLARFLFFFFCIKI